MNPLKLLITIVIVLNAFAHVSLSKENKIQTETNDAYMIKGKSNSQQPKNGMEVELSGCPRTLFFGDTFYHTCEAKNNTDNPIVFTDYNTEITEGARFSEGFQFLLSIDGITEQYDCVPEIYHAKYTSRILGCLTLAPGKSIQSAHPLEFPPLEALEHPFWRQVQEKMTPEGIECTLTVRIPKCYVDEEILPYPPAYTDYTFDILLKPRPAQEQTLLEKWCRETPKQFFPPVSLTRVDEQKWWYTEEMNEFEKTGYHRCNGNYIDLNGEKYNPWCFIRDGNRKPPATICPTTLEGWKALEESLTPSTMRDEITLVRRQLEYYGSQGEKQEKVLQELVEWLKTLPEPQRMSMASSLYANSPMGRLHDKSDQAMIERLRPSREKLLQTLLPMMSYYYRYVYGKPWSERGKR